MAARLTSSKTVERRGAPRVTEHLPLAIGEAGAEFAAETVDLSASGVNCVLDRFIPPMSKLLLRFELLHGVRREPIQCAGVVVRVEPMIASPERGRYRTAVFFTELSERHRASIARFVTARLAASTKT